MVLEWSTPMSRPVASPLPGLDTLSSNLADDSFKAQLSLMNRHLDKFQCEFHKS